MTSLLTATPAANGVEVSYGGEVTHHLTEDSLFLRVSDIAMHAVHDNAFVELKCDDAIVLQQIRSYYELGRRLAFNGCHRFGS